MRNFKTILFSTIIVLIVFSCSSDEVEDVITEIEVEEEVVIDDTDFIATDWTTETHSKDADANFNEVFEDKWFFR